MKEQNSLTEGSPCFQSLPPSELTHSPSRLFPDSSDFWWPHPDSLKDLVVEEVDHGFDLSAPDDSECGQWLAYFTSTPELNQLFQEKFIESLLNYIESLDNGQVENQPDRKGSDCAGGKENSPRAIEKNDPLGLFEELL
jgi:hypothetical protein